MANKTLVNGTAYTVQGGKCMVNGTVYNILKGRTLIDGTAWDITLPSVVTMPQKGDLITMNLDGTDRLYRVLKIVDRTTVEVLGMWNVSTSIKFDSNGKNTYAGKTLDTYLNTTWYNTLSTAAKAAIVPKNINQYQYSSGSYNQTTHASYADYSTKSIKANVGERYVYALDVEDIEMYFGGTGGSASDKTPATFSNTDLLQMFWNQTSTSSENPWLRSAVESSSMSAWRVYGREGVMYHAFANNSGIARPAFQIDLSKIDFAIGRGISFTINDTNYGGIGSYQADYGMTWEDWLSSPYNSVGYTANEFNEIISPAGHGSLFDESTSKYMKPTDAIEAGKSYTIVG